MSDKSNLFVVLRAETPVHVGVGQVDGAVDLPVAREATTHYPVIPGSGVKGALRDWAAGAAELNDDIKTLFGASSEDASLSAGSLIVSDMRLVLLPLRATTSTFRLATCPHILTRLNRDLTRLGRGEHVRVPKVEGGKYLGTGEKYLGLEEREFEKGADIERDLINQLTALTRRDDLETRLVILSDDDFAWFARYGLAVAAHNTLDDNKISKNLWYEETLPEETVMTLALIDRTGGACDLIRSGIDKMPYIQMGGNETTGHGWFHISVPELSNG